MRMQPTRSWTIAVAIVALCAATAGADDRDFLRERAAKPNILILLDTSTSMIGTSEVDTDFTLGEASVNINYGMLPGGGDDPRSRMGIAKEVLRTFLQNVTDANFALAGYQYSLPEVSGSPTNPFPAKQWTYQAMASDRFGFLEQGYAYRVGWAQRTLLEPTAPNPWINPSDFSASMVFGYNPYFDPDPLSANYVAAGRRYGPILAPELHPGNPYDLLPIYFMRNCETTDIASDGQTCGLRVFPYYTSLDLFGGTVQNQWTSSFVNCTPTAIPVGSASTDDGCRGNWVDDNLNGTVTQWVRRAHLEVPATVSGSANHPIGEDTSGNMSGNLQVADPNISPGPVEDYNLDGAADADYDRSETFDWLMRVNLVEERQSRVCLQPEPSPTPTNTPTVTNTPTHTPTQTPTNTPTPIPADCSDIYFTGVTSMEPAKRQRLRGDHHQHNLRLG